jgi:SAM-dependent methyltransferase
MASMGQRKILEAQFHDKLRDPALRQDSELVARLTSNKKWYSITRKSRSFAMNYIREHSSGSRALDYACGDGEVSFLMAESGADVVGIDISGVSIRNAEQEAKRRALQVQFRVMDCENLDFEDRSFDLINVSGVLHHLDLHSAYSELARVLKPPGSIICVEALAHNPLFHAYRKLTPHLRTEFEAEHILRRRDVLAAREFFRHIEWRFFHLVSLVAVPFRDSHLFGPILSALEVIDSGVLSLTPIRWWAWQIAFVLSGPRQ